MLKIIEGPIVRATKCVIYGPEGIGKSTMAAHAHEPLFIDLEDGTSQMGIRRIEKPGSWEELLSVVNEIANASEICRTLVIDTADWAEQLCARHICEKYNQTSIESFGYGKGYTYLQEEFAKLLKSLDKVIASGVHVIILAHAKMRKQELPDEAGAFDRWEMKLTRQVAPMLKEWCDLLLFLNYKTYIVADENNIKKAHGGKRVCYTTHHPCWDAKNRYGLPDEIEMDFKEIATCFPIITAHPCKRTLQEFLAEQGVTEEELQKVVSDKGKYPANIPVSEYDEQFIEGWIIRHWDKILTIIQANRK